jgi:hypothetical protein
LKSATGAAVDLRLAFERDDDAVRDAFLAERLSDARQAIVADHPVGHANIGYAKPLQARESGSAPGPPTSPAGPETVADAKGVDRSDTLRCNA